MHVIRLSEKSGSAAFVMSRPPNGLPGLLQYRQLDDHCCAFLAGLAVAKFFTHAIRTADVLDAFRPSPSSGCAARKMVLALAGSGIRTTFRSDLDLASLSRLLSAGTPVIVTVWPDDYACDHWTVVRGVDLEGRRVFLTNCEYADAVGGMNWDTFVSMWYDPGEGLLCAPLEATAPASCRRPPCGPPECGG
jgi:hypothetical protein